MARKIFKKYERELASLRKEMRREAKLANRSVCYEEAAMHQSRFALLRAKHDEIVRKAEFELESAYNAALAV